MQKTEIMKKIILFLLLLPTIAFAQHMTFMGIPIDGNLNNFGKQLQAKGFKIESTRDNTMFLNGKFAGEDVSIGVLSTMSQSVCRVIVVFDKKTSWQSLKAQFNKLKESYSAKYTLDKDFHFFLDPYYEGDGYEFSAVRNDKCRYSAFYKAQYGNIHLYISKTGCIAVTYEDTANIEKKERENDSEIQNDI